VKVRNGGEPPRSVDGEPRAVRDEVAAAEHVRRVRPPMRRLAWARMALVAIGGE
jgi:hypothetical protein